MMEMLFGNINNGEIKMKRLGKLTGVIYDENYDLKNCNECCCVITDEQFEDETFLLSARIKNKLQCDNCKGCPASQNQQQ